MVPPAKWCAMVPPAKSPDMKTRPRSMVSAAHGSRLAYFACETSHRTDVAEAHEQQLDKLRHRPWLVPSALSARLKGVR